MPNIKTEDEIQAMREGGKILAKILHELALQAKTGMTTEELNAKAEMMMAKHNVIPSFKGYRGFPAALCTSINEEIVHGIPGRRALKDGDILSIDCGVFYKGLHTDSAVTILIGNAKPDVREFVYAAQKALEKAFDIIRPGIYTGDIGFTIQHYVESRGYSIVRDFLGHGIGQALHEKPEVPNFGKKGKGALLAPGMTIAIEPIIAMGSRFCKTLGDNWTAVTQDGKVACQIEHTILITPNGFEVLTKYDNNINNVYPQ